MSLCALFALYFTYSEYQNHVKLEQYKTLSEYNKRYSEDPNIKIVVEYLIQFLENEQKEIKERTNENGDINNATGATCPSIYNKEMFMRFFEELQMQIDEGRISRDIVGDFFVYYAVAAAMCPEFLEHTELTPNTENSSEVWERYKKLVRNFRHLEKDINDDYLYHHSDMRGQKSLKIPF